MTTGSFHSAESTATRPTEHVLYKSIKSQLPHGLPIAAHLNADTSWLLLIPYPKSDLQDKEKPRYLKLLLDPWLTGYNEQGAFMSKLIYAEKHNIEPSVQTIAELRSVIKEIHQLEGSLINEPPASEDSWLDAIVVSNDNGDHCNAHTLEQLRGRTPVITLPLPMKLIKKWGYFANLHTMHSFASCVPTGSEPPRSLLGLRAGKPTALDWRLATYPNLPQWLSLSWTATPGEYPPFHTPLMIALPKPGSEIEAQAIVYTPHATPVAALEPFGLASPPISFLAIMCGLHRVWLTAGLLKIAGGADGGLEMAKMLNPQYWLATHDEIKETTAKGLIIPFLLRREQNDVSDVAKIAEKEQYPGKIVQAGDQREGLDIKVLQLGNGEACVLGEVEVQETKIRSKPQPQV